MYVSGGFLAQGTAYSTILVLEKGGVTHVSRRRLLAAGNVCCSAGGRYFDRSDLSGGSAAVPGGIFADRMRLRLLPTVERSDWNEYRRMEIPEGIARYPEETVQDP